MGLLDKLFHKSQPQHTQDVSTNPNGNIPSYFTEVQRADGSTIYINQIRNEFGPCYYQIGNKCIPIFDVIDPTLKQLSQFSNTPLSHRILIDFPNINDILKLDEPDYISQIANQLLYPARLLDVIENRHGYAGGLYYNEQGILSKFVDENVINYLNSLSREPHSSTFNQAEYTEKARIQGASQYEDNTKCAARKLSPDDNVR